MNGHPNITTTMNSELNRGYNEPLKDLPPKSPATRRIMPTVPPKMKRGEVKKSRVVLTVNLCIAIKIRSNQH